MIRKVSLAITAAMLIAGLAFADPRLEVSYHDGVPQVMLTGDWANSHYTVFRSSAADGPFAPITSNDVLCLGSCYADDFDAQPGHTYWYRFDIVPASGVPETFGPYPVTISGQVLRLGAEVIPNPSRAAAQIELFLSGSPSEPPLRAEAALFDLQGRRLRTLFRGELARGRTTLTWDGRDDAGLPLESGQFFLRFSSPLGVTITRVLRVR